MKMDQAPRVSTPETAPQASIAPDRSSRHGAQQYRPSPLDLFPMSLSRPRDTGRWPRPRVQLGLANLVRGRRSRTSVKTPAATSPATPPTSLGPCSVPPRRRHLMSDVVRLPHSEGVELGEAVEAFLAGRDLAPTSRRVYALTLAALIQDLGATTDVVTVGRRDLAEFLRRRHAGGAPKSWNRVVATLGSFFAYCDRQGWVGASPAVGLERRRERTGRSQAHRTRAIPVAELEAFLTAPRHSLRERLLWRMLYETAARAQEVLLDVEHLDVANRRATVMGMAATPKPLDGRRPRPGSCPATSPGALPARCSSPRARRRRPASRHWPTSTRTVAGPASPTDGRPTSSRRLPAAGRCTSCGTVVSPTWPKLRCRCHCSWPRAATPPSGRSACTPNPPSRL